MCLPDALTESHYEIWHRVLIAAPFKVKHIVFFTTFVWFSFFVLLSVIKNLIHYTTHFFLLINALPFVGANHSFKGWYIRYRSEQENTCSDLYGVIAKYLIDASLIVQYGLRYLY